MFFKIFAFLALAAVAFASPKPEPQYVINTVGAVPAAVGYAAPAPVAYSSPYVAAPAAYPYAYSGYYLR